MATDVEIASLALTRIGHESIASFSATGNKASRWFYANFETIKKALLREHPWNFAIKRVALVGTTTPVNEYTYAYTLPADFLRVVRINGDAKAGYRVERGTLATYEATATLEYVYDVTDEATFSADFTDLLAQRLAAEISLYMTDAASAAEMSWKLYEQKLSRARANDSRESAPRYRSANLALSRLGEPAGRQGEDGAVSLESAARHIEANYDTVRKALLREYPWNFAVKRVALVAATDPVNDYGNRFTLPTDCLRVVKLNASTELGWRIEAGYLVTDEAAATIEYIFNVTDEDAFDGAFLDLLAQRLAAEAAIALNPSSAQGVWRLYEEKLAKAKGTDAREAAPRHQASNLALLRLGEVAGRQGEDAAISRENAARVVEALWDGCRSSLLREHPWNFAIKRATLVATTAPTNDFTYAFTLPADFVRMVRLNASNVQTWRVEGAKLLTDISAAIIEYVYDVTDEALFDTQFSDLLSQRIAAEAAASVNPGAAQGMWTLYQAKLAQAKSADSRESAPRKAASNLALLRLGEVAGRAGEDAAVARENAARVVEALWDSCRKAVLREHAWNFAIVGAALVSAGGQNWTLPAAFIRAVRLNSGEDDYRITSGGILATTAATATLEYVSDVTNEDLFDPLFADVLSQRIAAEAAISINPGAAQALWTVYQQKLAAAMLMDTRERAPDGIVKNLAIARLGEVAGRPGTDAVATRENAVRIIESNYNIARKALLREHGWNFAVKRAILTKDTIRTITGATAANPVVITSAAHGFANGATVYIDSIIGMTQINGRTFTVANQATNTFQLSGENGLTHTAYASGGYAYPYIAKEYRYRFALPADHLRLLRINRTEADEYRVEQGYIYTDESEVDIEYVMDVTNEDSFDASFTDVLATRLAAEAAVAINPGATAAMWASYEQKLRMARTMSSREGTPRDIEADLWIGARA